MNENDIMMKAENSNRTRIIGLRLTPEEYATIEKKWKSSDCHKLSDYVRHILFNKQVTTTYRDQSTDDLMAQVMVTHREVNAIGNNFNQVVKKLHTLQQLTEFKQWYAEYQIHRRILSTQIETVKNMMQKLIESWLR